MTQRFTDNAEAGVVSFMETEIEKVYAMQPSAVLNRWLETDQKMLSAAGRLPTGKQNCGRKGGPAYVI
jgi:SPX domain protein involved in polyphosphate accumulation